MQRIGLIKIRKHKQLSFFSKSHTVASARFCKRLCQWSELAPLSNSYDAHFSCSCTWPCQSCQPLPCLPQVEGHIVGPSSLLVTDSLGLVVVSFSLVWECAEEEKKQTPKSSSKVIHPSVQPKRWHSTGQEPAGIQRSEEGTLYEDMVVSVLWLKPACACEVIAAFANATTRLYAWFAWFCCPSS